ncbi:stage VI sporulation protein D [Neobacillus bataviensis]|uniref:stage VI sporulation protein D n=1 Tax=Neobacillus bataviensis TaxID=220685 RepID=UPI0021BD274E|nr:stage VI sporulation protein D [Neobacillus bataviensis]
MEDTKGGVALSQENQSCLRFSLEESLWFRKGQEVEELISISLDPDITIQENDQYVTIRGSLQLSGEYKSYEASEVSEEDGVTSQKFVERVAELEEAGSCEFSHRFPVDITIPNNRIQSIYDIDVLVESFDYSIPERSCIKLSAELTISGLYGNEQVEQQQQEEEQEFEVLHRYEEEEVEVEQPAVHSSFENNFLFEAEARKPQEEEEPVEILPNFPTFNYHPQVEEEEEEEEETEEYSPAWNLQEARSEGSHPEAVETTAEVIVVKDHAPQHHEEIIVAEVEVSEESSSSSSEEPPKAVKKKKAAKKKSMTLTEFFARKDERTGQTKLKVCIVQKGDTVASLADRYDVSVPNLLRVNNLDLNQDVSVGQVLYIPGTLAKN